MTDITSENSPLNNFEDKSFNEKRKWQIALRRYVINKSKSIAYAPFFGIEIEGFRSWIASQFDDTMNWENFSKAWQLDHVVPVAYFNLTDESELRLCWSFINIRVEKLNATFKTHKPDVHGTRLYFEALYQHTGLQLCRQMITKISTIQLQEMLPNATQLLLIKDKANDLQKMEDFSVYEFERLNTGDTVNTLIAERALVNKFG